MRSVPECDRSPCTTALSVTLEVLPFRRSRSGAAHHDEVRPSPQHQCPFCRCGTPRCHQIGVFRVADRFQSDKVRTSCGGGYVQRQRRRSVCVPVGVEEAGQCVGDIVVLDHLIGDLGDVVGLQGESETADDLGAGEVAQVSRDAVGVHCGQQIGDLVAGLPHCEGGRCSATLIDFSVQDGQGDRTEAAGAGFDDGRGRFGGQVRSAWASSTTSSPSSSQTRAAIIQMISRTIARRARWRSVLAWCPPRAVPIAGIAGGSRRRQ